MEFALIATAHFLALLSPGPDFFLIMQGSLRLPLRYAIAICAGIATANAVYLLCAVLSLEIVREMDWLMILLRYLGAAYLVFLGYLLLRASQRPLEKEAPTGILQAHHLGKQFFIGFMSAILNPKNAIFYLSLFTVMVSSETGFFTRCLYAGWMTSVVFLWDCAVVMVIGQKRVKENLGRGIFLLEKISGMVLAMFGVLLAFT
ncbi:MAG: LysE family transporter [Deltaproteobacteria bacterium]|nr:LysE family transporter [Deltaproteobacteria bacterium]